MDEVPLNLSIPKQRVYLDHALLGAEPGPIAGIWYGITLIQAQMMLAHVMLDNGANWARVPIHWLRTNQKAIWLPVSTSEAMRWDTFSYHGDVTRFPFLRNQMADLLDSCLAGRYLFTVDYFDPDGDAPFAECPEQHKQHHFFDCDDGAIRARPNNMLRWTDPALYEPFGHPPKYQRVYDQYFAEGD